jgi:hypothetical protein
MTSLAHVDGDTGVSFKFCVARRRVKDKESVRCCTRRGTAGGQTDMAPCTRVGVH